MIKYENFLTCEIHNSPIGGVCSDQSCIEAPFIFCIKCVVDNNFCIKKKNHKLVSLKEYFDELINSKNMEEIKEFIKVYRASCGLNFQTARLNFKKVFDSEKIFSEKLINLIEENLTAKFEKEKEKIKQMEEMSFANFKNERDNLKNIKNEFKVTFHDESNESDINLNKYFENLLKSYKENKITKSEMFEEAKSKIKNLKLLLKKCDYNIFESLDKIKYFINFSTQPIKTIESTIELEYSIINKSLIDEINFYFKNFIKEYEISNNTSSRRSSHRRSSVSTVFNLQSSGSGPAFKELNNLKNRVHKDDVKSGDKNKYRYFSSFTKGCQMQVQSSSVNNDNSILIIDKYNLIVCCKSKSYVIFDFVNNKEIFSIQIFQEYYQNKYTMIDLNDYVYSINSSRELLEIVLTDFKEGSIFHKFYKFGTQLDEDAFAFEIVSEEKSLMTDENCEALKIIYISTNNYIQIWALGKDNLKFISSLKIVCSNYINFHKLEYFEANFNPTSEKYTLMLTNLKENLSNLNKKYTVHCNGDLRIYEIIDNSLVPYYLISNKYSKCTSFCLENLQSTNEAYLYSVWKTGSVNIYSLKTRTLIREINSFNLSHLPLYSVCFVNEKYLFVGSDKTIFLFNQANQKVARAKWTGLVGNIIGIKLYIDKNNQENFISFSDKGDITFWNNKKNN